MEKLSIGKLLLHYLSEKRKTAGIFLLCVLIFYTVCVLYQSENLQKLLYGFYLCFFILFCYGICDFIKYVRRCEALYVAHLNIESMPELLPPPVGFSERLYREIVSLLLEERRKMLFKANLKETEMSDYYTLWAHQIKTPIAAMKLLLQNTESQAETKELFKIEQYVDMVLHYLRLESMSSDFLFKQYALRDIVNQAVKKHAVLFINSRLSFNMSEFSSTVVTDEKWLLFVIEQIISNALKYTLRGSISIDVETTPEKTMLIIKDTGIGIRPEDLPRIFERGFTGYNGRLDKKSSGIGLYLCKQILDKLAHTIVVTSEVGKGTRVCICFYEDQAN
jgi:signal transduction histidine kinase